MSESVTEQDIQRYYTRIGGLAAITVSYVAAFITESQMPKGAPKSYPLDLLVISMSVFLFVAFPLIYFGTKWTIHPDTE